MRSNRRMAKSAGLGARSAPLRLGTIADWLTASRLGPAQPRLQPPPFKRVELLPNARGEDPSACYGLDTPRLLPHLRD
jgi:hypothetical protein